MTLKIVTPDGTEVRQKLVFTEPELAEELHTNTRMIAQRKRLVLSKGAVTKQSK